MSRPFSPGQTPANAATLLRLRAMPSQVAFNRFARDLVANGWSEQSIADVIGVSRQAVSRRVLRAYGESDERSYDLPPRPVQTVRPPKVPRLLVRDEIAEQLRRLQAIAVTVNGTTPLEDPRRTASEEFSAMLAGLVGQGVSVQHLAETIGVTRRAVRLRLIRHGYQEPDAATVALPLYRQNVSRSVAYHQREAAS